MASLYKIGRVAKITGLTPGCIRAWESRYGAVTPNRTPSGRRTYSEDNIARLKLLAEVVGYGYGISALAGLTDEELQRELQSARASDPAGQVIAVVDQVIENILDMNIGECDSRLAAAFVNLGPWQLAETVIGPILDAIDAQSGGALSLGHGYLILNLLRSRLHAGFQTLQGLKRNPVVCFTTLEGEAHEIDALMSCYLARSSGVYSEFVGPNISAPRLGEIAGILKCTAVAVSVRAPLAQSNAVARLNEVAQNLPAGVQLWIGGPRSAEAGSSVLTENRFIIEDLARLREQLDKLAETLG